MPTASVANVALTAANGVELDMGEGIEDPGDTGDAGDEGAAGTGNASPGPSDGVPGTVHVPGPGAAVVLAVLAVLGVAGASFATVRLRRPRRP